MLLDHVTLCIASGISNIQIISPTRIIFIDSKGINFVRNFHEVSVNKPKFPKLYLALLHSSQEKVLPSYNGLKLLHSVREGVLSSYICKKLLQSTQRNVISSYIGLKSSFVLHILLHSFNVADNPHWKDGGVKRLYYPEIARN
jgi:hypothetical protein